MTESASSPLADVLKRLQIQLTEPVDITRTDPEATTAKVRLLSAAATYFNVLAISEFGGRPGAVRHEGLVEQIVAAAFQTYGGEDPHPAPFDKAAMLWRGITRGHPFANGNTRAGFLLTLYYLDRIGYVLRPGGPTAMVVSFCRRISAGEVHDLDLIAATLRAWSEPRHGRPDPT